MMKIYLAIILSALLAAGCGTQVTRLETDEVTDLSGEWNDTDSRLVAEEMISDALAHPWTSNFAGQKGRARSWGSGFVCRHLCPGQRTENHKRTSP